MALLTQLYSTTRQNRKRPVADTISENNALMYLLKEKGHIKDDGGRDIGEPLIYDGYDAETVKFFDGYDTFTVDTTQEVVTEAVYEWKELGGFTFLSKAEERKNRGQHAAVKLLNAKDQALLATLKNKTEVALCGDGTGFGGKAFSGLQVYIADDPTAASTVGGIDQTYTWWRNQTSVTNVAITSSNIQSKMNALQLACTFGDDQPDCWIGDSVTFSAYWASLQENMRHTNAKMADAGFRTLEFLGKPVVYSSSVLASRMYALNTNYLTMRCNGAMYEDQDPQQIQGGFYTLFPNYTMANLTCNNRSRQGVLGDNT